ncbi:actin cytoskeleton-regulatory complex protein pan1-like [Pollicipes pollicipes]|uniref:actin cytoskeleton-regulatory complex protein pan1-like n=1 Tax=Pollicipes pollicipes TaxID=41117 RepID=UPI0018856046|nr:actin cytoskeleton-regulatory complex protein pan1-like [Pollicipes pollicipes]
MEGQLPSTLLGSAELAGLTAHTVYMLPRQPEPAGASAAAGSVYDRLAAEAQTITEYIDLSKAHLPGLVVEPVPAARETGADRVSLQHEFPRWQAAKQRLNLSDDHQLARVLLDLLESSLASAQLVKSEDLHDVSSVLHCEMKEPSREAQLESDAAAVTGSPSPEGTVSMAVAGSVPAPGPGPASLPAPGSVPAPALAPASALAPVLAPTPAPVPGP